MLDGVSFDLHAGEILGIGGLLGSGRTEILETIFGVARGRARRRDHARRRGRSRSARRAMRGGSASRSSPRTARRQGLHLGASIRDNVALPLAVGALARFGLRSFARRGATCRARGAGSSAIRCTGIEQAAGTLSGGNQQKVVIGKWLATRPRVLLLDEPTRGIDVGAKREIYDLDLRAGAAEGLAIVVVSSELPELLLLSDRILVDVRRPAAGHAAARDEPARSASCSWPRRTRADGPGRA